MGASQGQRLLIALDTNVLLDLAAEVDDVTDGVLVIRRRLRRAQLLMPPTVGEELAAEAIEGESFAQRENAKRAFQLARTWKVQPVNLAGPEHEAVRSIGRRLRGLELR